MNSQITPQQVYDVLKSLPEDSLRQVWDYIETIRHQKKRPDSTHIIKLGGLFAEYGVDISEDDIAEARRDMWGNLGESD